MYGHKCTEQPKSIDYMTKLHEIWNKKKLSASRSTKVSDVSLKDSERTVLLNDIEIVDWRLSETLF